MPTPTRTGGQALGPAAATVSTMNRFAPSQPAEGGSIFSWPMFSAPPPLVSTRMRSLSPGTMSM